MVKMNQDVMSTRPSKFFFNIFFRQLIMNIDCEINKYHKENSEDDYIGYIQKFMILRIIQQIFYEMLICGEKNINCAMFF